MKWLNHLLGPKPKATKKPNPYVEAYLRSLENPQMSIATPWWYGQPALAGLSVNEHTALNYSPYWDALYQVSVDTASLKFEPTIIEPDGHAPAKDHWSYPLVRHSPDGIRPALRFWATIIQHACNDGNGFAEIIRAPDGWRGQKFQLLNPKQVEVLLDERYGGERLIYKIHDQHPRTLLPFNVIHIANPMSYDGVRGKSILQAGRESIGLGLGAEISMAAWNGNSARPGGRYKLPMGMDEEGTKNFREYVDELHGGPMNNGRPAIDPPGVEWKNDVLPAPDEAYLNSRIFQIQEVARWFHMPPTRLGDYSHSTFANLEQAEKSYWKTAIKPWADFICAELNLKLFTPSESHLYCRANFHELTVTDLAAKTAYYSAGRQWGWLSVNRILELEGQNGIGDAGDVFLTPTNMMTDQQVLQMQYSPPPTDQTPAPPAPTQETAPNAKALDAVRGVVKDGLARMARREAAAIRRAASKSGFGTWLDGFYSEHNQAMVEQLTPAYRALEAVTGDPINVVQVADEWCEESSSTLKELAAICLDEQMPEAVEDILKKWEGRI